MTSNKSIEDMFKAAKMIKDQYGKIYCYISDELDYYLFHHVCIGLVYRQFKIALLKTFTMLLRTRRFLIDNNIDMGKNVTLNKQSLLVRLFAIPYKI